MATLARVGIASNAAITMCMIGMMTPMPRPSATARGTERRVIRHSSGRLRCRANGRSKR